MDSLPKGDISTSSYAKGELARRIEGVSSAFQDRVLLQDDSLALTGRGLAILSGKIEESLELSCRRGGRVGIFMPNSAAKAAATLAVLQAGRVPVMIPMAEQGGDFQSRLAAMKLHSLILDASWMRNLNVPVSKIGLSLDGEIELGPVVHSSRVPLPPDDVALILYTSGSSGEPKGVRLSETALLYNVDALQKYQAYSSSTIAAVTLPICHTMALNTQFLPTFLAGGKSVFFDATLNLDRVYKGILDSKATSVALISHLIKLCEEERKRRRLPAAETVRQVTLAGGVIRPHHLASARELFPNAVVYKGYGLTEAIRVSMINSNDPAFLENTAGRPLPGQELQVRDEDGVVLPTGEIGHIHVRGPNVMSGYDNVEENPVAADGFLETHDMGYIHADGRLSVLGRSDGIVKISGKRVSLRAIEDIVHEAWPDASEVKCISVPSDREELALVLFVEMGEELGHFTRSRAFDWERALQTRLKGHRYVPREAIMLPRFPRTPNGKIRPSGLKELWLGRKLFSEIEVSTGARSFKFYVAEGEAAESLESFKASALARPASLSR